MNKTYFTKEARTARKEAQEARDAEIIESNNKTLKVIGGAFATCVAGAVAVVALATRRDRSVN